MSLHEQLYQWTARQGLDAISARRLRLISGLDQPPDDLVRRWRLGAMALGAGLVGLGVVMWVAANWHELGRVLRFGLLQALLAGSVLAAASPLRWRTAAGVLALLTGGAQLALLGQTYQTGADPWQLFALWAVLSLPLAAALRSELVWTPWTVVAGIAVLLWMDTHAAGAWSGDRETLPVHALGLFMLTAGVLALRWRSHAQADREAGRAAQSALDPSGRPWSYWTALLFAAPVVAMIGLSGLSARPLAPQWSLALAVCFGALVLAWRVRDVLAMSLLALCVDGLLIGLALRWLSHGRSTHVPAVALVCVAGLVLLSVSAALIVRRSGAADRSAA